MNPFKNRIQRLACLLPCLLLSLAIICLVPGAQPARAEVEYTVHHQFKDLAGGALPAAVTALTPGDRPMPDRTTVHPTGFSPQTVEVAGGRWTFLNWEPASATVDGWDVTFIGYWHFTPADYPVTYAFVSWLPGAYPLPAYIDANYKPSGQSVGTGTVNPANPSQPSYANELGTWTFQGWSPSSVTIDGAAVQNAHFVGTWQVTFFNTYSVEYVLNGGVTTSPQTTFSGLQYGAPAPTITQPTRAADKYNTYAFTGWSPAVKPYVEGNTRYEALWSAAPIKYVVGYQFVSGTPGRSLPQSVTDLTPGRGTARQDDVVRPAAFSPASIAVDGGTWNFAGWATGSKTIDGAGVTFIGTWKFTPTQVNFDELLKLLQTAKEDKAGASEGNGDGQYPPAAMAALQSATDSAQAVADNASASQQMVDDACSALGEALSAFRAAKISVTKAPVESTLKEARDLLAGAEVGDQPGQYPQDAMDALRNAADSADALANKPGVTQAELDQANIGLQKAIGDFQASVVQRGAGSWVYIAVGAGVIALAGGIALIVRKWRKAHSK